jgi:hypothetical protein
VAGRKVARSGSADDEGPTYLASGFTSAMVSATLDDRIAKGSELLAQIHVHVFPEPGRFDDLNREHSAWHNYNATYLERAFTTKELRKEFEGMFFGMIGSRQTDLDRMRDLARDLQRDIGKLTDIQGRLLLYERPGHQLEAATPRSAAPVPRTSIHVTFQGQVGQVNLAELIRRVDASIEQVDQRGEGDLANALKQLTDAIKAAGEAAADQRDDALDAVAVLAEVGAQPVDERPKLRGRVRGAISVIANLAEIAPVVKATWEAVGPSIMEHLPRLNS